MKTLTNNNVIAPKKGRMAKVTVIATTLILTLAMCGLSFAAVDGADKVQEVLGKMVEIVGMVFQAVGAMLSVYSVGQLVMAFKNEDADSKSRASTMLVVGIVLIAIPTIITGLNLTSMVGA